ncbi:hypothetical protein CF328_g8081, partial [Tilletia controversa]
MMDPEPPEQMPVFSTFYTHRKSLHFWDGYAAIFHSASTNVSSSSPSTSSSSIRWDYIVVTTKALPDIVDDAAQIKPLVANGHSAIVLIQNGVGIERIRRADQTDPDTLLVSHNRIGGGQSGAVPLKGGPNERCRSQQCCPNVVQIRERRRGTGRREEGVNNGGASNQYNGSPRRNGGAASSRLAHRKNRQTKQSHADASHEYGVQGSS